MSESNRKRPRIDESDDDSDPVNPLEAVPVLPEGEDSEAAQERASIPPHQASNNDSGGALTSRDILEIFGVESVTELRKWKEAQDESRKDIAEKIKKHEEAQDELRKDIAEKIKKHEEEIKKHEEAQDELRKDYTEKIKKHEEDIAEVKGRLDSISGAFVPKTVYALLETAVFESIRSFPLMPGDQQGSVSSMDEVTKQSARYGVARACSLVLEVFFKTQPDLLYKERGKFKNWAGTSNVPKTGRTALVCQGMHGFIAFVEKANRNLLDFWSQDVRNNLGHNGAFLDAVYPSAADGSLINRAVTEDTVRDMRASFSERAEGLDTALLMALGPEDLKTTIDEKLTDVVRVLREKEIRVTDNCRDKAFNFLLGLEK